MPFLVLVIDDDKSFGRLLELRLRSFIPDLNVTTIDTLEGARQILCSSSSSDLDLVFLDQNLPDGQGVQLLKEGLLEKCTVICVSSDETPEIPGETIRSGASFFLKKTSVAEPLFKPLVLGILERAKLEKQLNKAEVDAAILETVRTLVATLRHEINNPLGAVLGVAYLLETSSQELSEDQKKAVKLLESSGNRIKHVLDQLCKAISVEPVQKAKQTLFHIPGDKPWE